MAIPPERITSVLLTDGWHHVEESSFEVEKYAFHAVPDGPDSATGHVLGHDGFRFREAGAPGVVAGPISAVVAVRFSG